MTIIGWLLIAVSLLYNLRWWLSTEHRLDIQSAIAAASMMLAGAILVAGARL